MDIPEYYRKYQNKSAEQQATPKPDQQKEKTDPHVQDEFDGKLFQANAFTIKKLEGWQDKTIYTLTGPVENGIQHNVIITVETNNAFHSLLDYADWNIQTLENELKGCRLLKKDQTVLNNGIPAYEAVFSWYPTDELRIYQQQLYILTNKTGYKLTASFTKKTRQTLGPKVERMMLSFNPLEVESI
jgi:hypothetical protein